MIKSKTYISLPSKCQIPNLNPQTTNSNPESQTPKPFNPKP